MERHDITTQEDIKLLVDSFYKKVIADDVIGHIFTDIAKLDFEKHMPKMYAFWSTILFADQAYSSNPMQSHIALDKLFPLQHAHFERWLQLWEGNIHQQFTGPVAEQALQRAHSIASVMEYKITSSRKGTSIL